MVAPPHLLSISSFIKKILKNFFLLLYLGSVWGHRISFANSAWSMFLSFPYFFGFQSRAQSLTFNLFKSLTFNSCANKPVVGQFHSMSKAKNMSNFVLTTPLFIFDYLRKDQIVKKFRSLCHWNITSLHLGSIEKSTFDKNRVLLPPTLVGEKFWLQALWI